jgi:hypothetical protein
MRRRYIFPSFWAFYVLGAGGGDNDVGTRRRYTALSLGVIAFYVQGEGIMMWERKEGILLFVKGSSHFMGWGW